MSADPSRKNALDAAIRLLFSRGDCEFSPPTGNPNGLRNGSQLPEDLEYFYSRFGGADLFDESSLELLSPTDFAPSIEKVFSSEYIKNNFEGAGESFWWWYAIAFDGGGLWISIDLHPDRLGRCYLCFSEEFAVPGRTPIIARSFTELLQRLAVHEGPEYFWERPGFESYGDALMPLHPED